MPYTPTPVPITTSNHGIRPIKLNRSVIVFWISFFILAVPTFYLLVFTFLFSYGDTDFEHYGVIATSLWLAMPVIGIVFGAFVSWRLSVQLESYRKISLVMLTTVTTAGILILNSALVVTLSRVGYWYRPERTTDSEHFSLFVEHFGIPMLVISFVLVVVVKFVFVIVAYYENKRRSRKSKRKKL